MNTVYTTTVAVPRIPEAVFDVLIHQVEDYWPEAMEGSSIRLDDEFIFRSGEDHYSKNKVTQFVPAKKLAWLVTDSIRKTDYFSWTGTQMIFELEPQGRGTRLTFTYDGEVMEHEQDRLAGLCDLVVKGNLNKLLHSDSVSVTITISAAPEHVFEALLNVKKWWGFEDLEGKSSALYDVFTIRHPGTHYSKQQVTELVPGKYLVFEVIESNLSWLKDPAEWTGTRLVFELSPGQLRFTHEGLTPAKECYAQVSEGWRSIISDNFLKTVNDMKKVSISNHASVVVQRSERGNIRKFYLETLGGELRSDDPERDLIRLGDDFFIAFLYDDVPDESEIGRKARFLWLELKTGDVPTMTTKILTAGVRKLDIPDPHLYFQAPGGQVWRLVGADEDMSFYEGRGDGPDVSRVKAAL
ncbi:hypothetical protein FO440_22055 [Mucilaginibacter corticis]|uniref:Activator of Hsp90 ATPase homologue 1/2-like C-terminal domain-containing protein n=1 Tax=Mucilaginibacter corticis TaxID=2597670 RepID=A0A556M9C0_9SPHI|nr:SRPBCC family protein [Mucilaginibacter corticis]TSJ36517.1 hypothetical protein FO440_22055 [Mucilaginibacter corticis]